MQFIRKNIFIFISALVLLVSGCKKSSSTTNSGIPNVAVDITIYTTDPLFVQLTVVGGWKYVTGGYGGILIYRQNLSTFMAYDRACPYDWSNSNARVQVQKSGITVTDSASCHSSFLMSDGSVNHGPASLPLKQYRTTFDGTSALHIFN